jgi:hypothetical protein
LHQMLDLDEVSGSINPYTLRTNNDPNGKFGAKHAKHALGGWWSNPNHAVITVEAAGFQKDGPNPKQVETIQKLFSFLVKKYPRIIPLGHRDFQNVKPCPGQKFFNAVYHTIGGHGMDYEKSTDGAAGGGSGGSVQRGDEMIVSTGIVTSSDHVAFIKDGTSMFYEPDGDEPALRIYGDGDRPVYGYGRFGDSDWTAIGIKTKQTFTDGKTRPVIGWVKGRLETRKVTPPPPPPPDSELLKQIEELQERIRIAREALASS